MRRLFSSITLAALLLISPFAESSTNSTPDWVTKIPSDDTFFYGVGIGEGASEAEARNLADQDAVQKLFEAVFGVHLSAQSKGSSTIDSETLHTNWTSELEGGFLDKIRRTECSHTLTRNQIHTVYCLIQIERSVAIAHQKSFAKTKQSKRGYLTIDSLPSGAILLIDSKAQGVTPSTMTLQPGVYEVEISMTGFQKVSKKITIRSGEKLTSTILMESTTGNLVVNCKTPGAILVVDGTEAPGAGDWSIELKSGPHKIVLKGNDRKEYTEQFDLEGGETKEIQMKLEKDVTPRSSPKIKPRVNADSETEATARSLLEEHNWAALIKLCRANRRQSWVRNSYYYESAALNEMGLYSEAKDAALQSLESGETSAARQTLCNILGNLDQFTAARAECDKAILLNPEDTYVLLIKARVTYKNYRQRSFDSNLKRKAIEDYAIAAKLNSVAAEEFKSVCREIRSPFDTDSACKRIEY